MIGDSIEARNDIFTTHRVQGSIKDDIGRIVGVVDRLGGGQRHQGEGEGEDLADRHCDKKSRLETIE